MEDPAGLRRPELGTSGVERREEQPFGVMVEIGSKEKERGGQPFGKEQFQLCVEGVPPSSLFIGEGEGSHLGGGGSPKGCALGFPLP